MNYINYIKFSLLSESELNDHIIPWTTTPWSWKTVQNITGCKSSTDWRPRDLNPTTRDNLNLIPNMMKLGRFHLVTKFSWKFLGWWTTYLALPASFRLDQESRRFSTSTATDSASSTTTRPPSTITWRSCSTITPKMGPSWCFFRRQIRETLRKDGIEKN